MARLIDIEDKNVHKFLSVNFLMAEFLEFSSSVERPIVVSDLEKYNQKDENYLPSTEYMNNTIDVFLFHRAISRTFDIGRCPKID